MNKKPIQLFKPEEESENFMDDFEHEEFLAREAEERDRFLHEIETENISVIKEGFLA